MNRTARGSKAACAGKGFPPVCLLTTGFTTKSTKNGDD